MTVTIHQPCFFPYPGVFKKIAASDVLIFLDDVQYTKGEFFERNRIKTPQGVKWFKIPIDYRFGDTLNSIRIKHNVAWRDAISRTLDENYKDAPHFSDYYTMTLEAISNGTDRLTKMSALSMKRINEVFGLRNVTYNSSWFNVPGKKTEKLVNLCKEVGATKYLSGAGGRNYLDEELFAQAGIEVKYSDFHSPEYPQQHGEPFIPNLSILDYLFNCGADRDILR